MKEFERVKELCDLITSQGKVDDFSQGHVLLVTTLFNELFECLCKTLKIYMLNELGVDDAKTNSWIRILTLACEEGILNNISIWRLMLHDYKCIKKGNADWIKLYEYKHTIDSLYLKTIYCEIVELSSIIKKQMLNGEELPESFIRLAVRSAKGITGYKDYLCEQYSIDEKELLTNWNKYEQISKRIRR